MLEKGVADSAYELMSVYEQRNKATVFESLMSVVTRKQTVANLFAVYRQVGHGRLDSVSRNRH